MQRRKMRQQEGDVYHSGSAGGERAPSSAVVSSHSSVKAPFIKTSLL